MRISADKLPSHLKMGLRFPCYWIAGDDPVLLQEARDCLMASFRSAGFLRSAQFNIQTTEALSTAAVEYLHFSLFEDKKLIILQFTKIPSLKVFVENYLIDWIKKPANGKQLLIITPKLEASTLRMNFFKKIEGHIAFICVWSLAEDQFTQWFKRNCQEMQLFLTAQQLQSAVAYTQGNTQTAKQLLMQLRIIAEAGKISDHGFVSLLCDTALVSLYALPSIIFKKDVQACYQAILRLQRQSFEPVLLLWFLGKELRLYLSLLLALEAGEKNCEAIFSQYQVRSQQQGAYLRFVQKTHSLLSILSLQRLLFHLDYEIKTNTRVFGFWDKIHILFQAMAGVNILPFSFEDNV